MALSPIASTNAPSVPSVTDQSQGSVNLNSDFNSFIKMLTAQARFQDPLDPIDSTEFASQLAQFSMVEQQVQTNNTLGALVSALGTSSMSSLSGWVGMEARAITPMFFDGDPIEVSPNPYALADTAYMVVTDDSGKEIYREEIEISSDSVEWAGTDDEGNAVEDGLYFFTIESFEDEELVLAEAAGVYGRIGEAQIIGGEVALILEGGQPILASSVTALRSPE